ncbi:hypothetical protein HN51_045420, partial [Arachis hypogaea]
TETSLAYGRPTANVRTPCTTLFDLNECAQLKKEFGEDDIHYNDGQGGQLIG